MAGMRATNQFTHLEPDSVLPSMQDQGVKLFVQGHIWTLTTSLDKMACPSVTSHFIGAAKAGSESPLTINN